MPNQTRFSTIVRRLSTIQLRLPLTRPLAGWLYDATKSYDYSFYFAGILITLSAVLCYPLNYVNTWEKRRALEKANNTAGA